MSTEWTRALARADVPDERHRRDGRRQEIALYGVDGEVYATDNLCTHGNARLCDGFLMGHEIECPLHQGRFDVRDGRALCSPLRKTWSPTPSGSRTGSCSWPCRLRPTPARSAPGAAPRWRRPCPWPPSP